jgi:GDPmannose 4,6-dehydratase
MARALITGIGGQDGSYLAEQLLAEGAEVYGLARRKADGLAWRIAALLEDSRFKLIPGDVTDPGCIARIISELRPSHVYNLAAQSFVPFSWDAPMATAQATALGALNILEALRAMPTDSEGKPVRYYQASSSEMFGNAPVSPQDEDTVLRPRSPYGVSKVFAHNITVNYRESYGLFAVSGILFNHESERRGLAFVTRKVTWAAARIKRALQESVALGNLDAARDWGYAPDYTRAMRLMLAADAPDDYVIATGKSHTVRQLCEATFGALDLDWQKHVVTDPAFLRPAELHALLGDSGKARRELGWEPQVSFEQMIERMAVADLARVDSGVNWEV